MTDPKATPSICKHGSLARSCSVCDEVADALAAAEGKVAELQSRLAAHHDAYPCHVCAAIDAARKVKP